MAEAAVLYTRGDPNAADQRGESMVERHQRKIREEKEYSAHTQLKVLLPDAGPALRNLALEGCEWDVDRARTMIKRFREVKARDLKHARERLAAAEQGGKDKAEGAATAKDQGKPTGGEPESNGSGSESESDSGSGSESSDEEARRKDRKRSSKHRKQRKESSSRKKHKKDSKRKKDSEQDREEKKAKRRKHGKDAAAEPRSAALTYQFGKYGIIRESDYEAKRGDFQLWATEVKKVEVEVLPKWEERELFKTYMEDYNTGTLPHKKYYDNDAYERARALKEIKKGRKSKKTEWTAFDDEADRRREAAKRREEEMEERQRQAYNELRYTTNKAQEMRDQELLRQQMNLAYRTGNMDEARRIQERLNPDDDPSKP
mmetsp:Transcript_18463/g.51709  ORF Transcript_18463/g.51709 Transcript_18463/m.51709 type:complete len:374 (+) Transcript_18463:198-1319(+)|eukprot:CAMPEP_0117667236 /NCGR_PEP_ID=MMETSP0804-20121206/10844_1 /TAXON_ID=1074897 /ORGANISM="Tetraselmis astigmatica, Strain CCMP880" /LENGTH=373 /DNA_ID=CAMNT_0005474919 /DNA_START=127 /DNA_END=1248 /DNA_ORIENTATION=+